MYKSIVVCIFYRFICTYASLGCLLMEYHKNSTTSRHGIETDSLCFVSVNYIIYSYLIY